MEMYGGEIWYTSLGPQIMLVLNKPELISDVFNYKAKYYKKAGPKNKNKELFGNSVTNSAGAQWKRQRRTLAPSFKYSSIKESVPLIKKCCLETFEKWEKTLVIENLGEWTNRTLLNISCQLLFGGSNFVEDFLARYQIHPQDVFVDYTKILSKSAITWGQFFPLYYRSFPFPSNAKMNKYIAMLREAAKFAIEQRREKITHKWEQLSSDSDFLDAVLNHVQFGTFRVDPCDQQYLQKDRPMDENEMVDNVVNFIIASYLPTARFIEFALLCLYKYPEYQELLYQEIIKITTKDSATSLMDYADQLVQLQEMTYFEKEVLRMFPPTDHTIKIALQNHYITDGIRKYYIPQGARIKIGAYGTHMNQK